MKNLFLEKLSEETYKRIEPHLETIEMPIDFVVYKPFQPVSHIYFPENSLVSIVTVLENGACVETGIIGSEGIAGFEGLLSGNLPTKDANSQLTGKALRIKFDLFKTEFERSDDLQRLTLRYVSAFIEQISQNAACLLLHHIENRLARWLLMVCDRAGSNKINLTQEFIALMLGVHRPSVSKAAGGLQERNLIEYSRGSIIVTDIKGLEQTACECYETIRESVARYLNFKAFETSD